MRYLFLLLSLCACSGESPTVEKNPPGFDKPVNTSEIERKQEAFLDSFSHLGQLKNMIDWALSEPPEGVRPCFCPEGHSCPQPGEITLHKTTQGFMEDLQCESKFESGGQSFQQIILGQIYYSITKDTVQVNYSNYRILWQDPNDQNQIFDIRRDLKLQRVGNTNKFEFVEDFRTSITEEATQNLLLDFALMKNLSFTEIVDRHLNGIYAGARANYARKHNSSSGVILSQLDLRFQVATTFTECRNPIGIWNYYFTEKTALKKGQASSNGVVLKDSLESKPVALPSCLNSNHYFL